MATSKSYEESILQRLFSCLRYLVLLWVHHLANEAELGDAGLAMDCKNILTLLWLSLILIFLSHEMLWIARLSWLFSPLIILNPSILISSDAMDCKIILTLPFLDYLESSYSYLTRCCRFQKYLDSSLLWLSWILIRCYWLQKYLDSSLLSFLDSDNLIS